jgi:signal transduction histidine kinase
MLGMSTSNLRREQLKQALDTMGIMAHELRTPLATMNLIGEAMRQEARTATPLRREQVEHLAHRLLNLVRNMHRQIDTQITNARLLRLPPATDLCALAQLSLQRTRCGRDPCVQVGFAQEPLAGPTHDA